MSAIQPQRQSIKAVTRASPALLVMTDLTESRAATVSARLPLNQAEQAMIQQSVRLLFVTSRLPCIDGVITADLLMGEKPIAVARQRQFRISDLCVADVMTPLSDLDVLDLSALEHATVGDVVDALRRFGVPYLLVAESATALDGIRIRGIISHTQIERQLGMPLPMVPVARTFAEIEEALA